MPATVESELDPRYEVRDFKYTGTDQLDRGYALCFDADAGTASLTDVSRGCEVEKPASGNLHNFAGLVETKPHGVGPCNVKVILPRNGVQCAAHHEVNATLGTGILCVQAGSYKLGALGTGLPVAIASRTVNRSSVSGLGQVSLYGPSAEDAYALTAEPTRGPSRIIWETCPWGLLQRNPGLGYTFFDDFMAPLILADTVAQGGYCTKSDTGVTIQSLETLDEVGGVLEIANNDDDVDFGHIFLGDPTASLPCIIAAAAHKPFWFEARFKKASIATDSPGLFLGLGEVGLMDDAGLVVNTAEVKDENFIGFQVLCAAGATLLPVFKADGQTKANGTGVTMVADTYVNVGLHGNGTIITAYVNGVSKHAITATLIAGATFPSATPLTLALMTQTGAATECQVAMDWWRFAQLA